VPAASATLEKAATTICRGNSCEDIIAKFTSTEAYGAASYESRLTGSDKDENVPSGFNAVFRRGKF
jgi:hypothetical protein